MSSPVPSMRVILASASPARLDTLRRAGIDPEVIVSGVDESRLHADTPAQLVAVLAKAKGVALDSLLSPSDNAIVIACDSLLELDGRACGKPGTPERAKAQWLAMRGRTGFLHTGHYVLVQHDNEWACDTRVSTTTVEFANVTDAEIDAYVATGEPLQVAGAFTIDGYGGAFVTRIKGDPHNVIGLSLPLVREMLLGLGMSYTSLWNS